MGFTFDRSGYRVPAVVVSPWVAEGEVFNDEYRHTSLIATLREQWDLGEPFTERDAAARTLADVFTLDTPRDPTSWPVPTPRPVPEMIRDDAALERLMREGWRGTPANEGGPPIFPYQEYDRHNLIAPQLASK